MPQAIVNALSFFERIAAAPRVGNVNVSAMTGIRDPATSSAHHHGRGAGPPASYHHKNAVHVAQSSMRRVAEGPAHTAGHHDSRAHDHAKARASG